MKVLLFISLIFLSLAASADISEHCAVRAEVKGAIGIASYDLLQGAVEKANREACDTVLLTINTPGGSLQTTRKMVETILNSGKIFMCLVSPAGGHAGSAGAIILQACHVAGAIETTNIGAATPVSGGGKEMGKDLRNKMINDTRSWVEGLAKLRSRDVQFAKDIIELAKSVTATEAKRLGAIDYVVTSEKEFVIEANGKKVKVGEKILTVSPGLVIDYNPGLKNKVLQLVGDPELSYMMFMGSIGLLYFELTHPGTILPGVIGGVGLVVSLISFHKLDVQWGGLLLILLGLLFMIGEAFVPSFGALGLGGVIAFFLGSFFLFDPEVSGSRLPLMTILPTVLALGLATFGLAYLAVKSLGLKKSNEFHEIVGKMGKVINVEVGGKEGQLEVYGEIWSFESESVVSIDDEVKIKKHKGLKLFI